MLTVYGSIGIQRKRVNPAVPGERRDGSNEDGGPNAKPRERLTRDRVVDAALRIMDAEGLDAVTMRRVAREVGVEAMSLYHHVRDKEDLLDGIRARVFSEFAFDADPDDPSRIGSRASRHAWRRLLRTHPNVIALWPSSTRPHDSTRSPAAHGVRALEVLRSMGVPDPDVMQVFNVFGGYIHGLRDDGVGACSAFAERDRGRTSRRRARPAPRRR